MSTQQGIDPHILQHVIRWKWVVNFIHGRFMPRNTAVTGGYEVSWTPEFARSFGKGKKRLYSQQSNERLQEPEYQLSYPKTSSAVGKITLIQAMKVYREQELKHLSIVNLDNIWRHVVNLRSDSFVPEVKYPCTHFSRGLVATELR